MLASAILEVEPPAFPMAERPQPKPEEMATRIRTVMAKRNLEEKDIEHLTNGLVAQSRLKNWIAKPPAKLSEPGAFGLAALAQALEVSVDYLLYGPKCEHANLDDVATIRKASTETEKAVRIRLLLPLLRRHVPDLFPVTTRIQDVEKHQTAVVDEAQAIIYTQDIQERLEVLVPGLRDAWDKLMHSWEQALKGLT